MTFVKKWIFLSLLFPLALSVQAQKFGYVDSNGILESMPEVKEMRSNLSALQTQLTKQGQKMVEEYQTTESDAMKRKQSGNLSPAEEEAVISELTKKQEEVMKFEQKMQQRLLEKEQELLQPILKKVRDAIDDVAKDGGYQFIFDAGVLLYATEATNVNNAVRAKLGLQ